MAMILDAFTSKMSDLLLQMLQDEAVMLLGVPCEIKKLNKTLGYIRCVLADAEQKKNTSSAIELWLKELKDVMYDADDVIDLCQIKAQERADRSDADSPSSSNKGCGFVNLLSCFRNLAFAHEIGTMIREINSRLDEIANQKADLGLIPFPIAIGSHQVSRVDTFIKRKTDSLVLFEDIVGEKIEEDARLIVNWLIDQEGVKEKVPVVAIVGMGGIGKTTLAQRIFNDTIIKEEFQLKIWTCVSKEVKGVELLKGVIQAAGGQYDGTLDRSVLVDSLKDLVEGRKFLLVLDDVWQESQGVWSDLLRAPMMAGAQGSRLLVTTRDERVATGIKAVKSHRVEKMSEEDGWSLLAKQVFQNEEQSEIQQFKNIGVQLVKKCDGLPLAIKSIGGLLCTKNKTTGAWLAILGNNAWTMKGLPADVHHALYLSYDDLPSPLKQCFIASSLYPEDFKFDYYKLIYFWIAEGFLQGDENLWELGKGYYRELLQRNLLEDTYKNYDAAQCKMHDLFWSLGRYMGKDENLILTEGDSTLKRESSSKLRRLSVERQEVKSGVVNKEKWLRTLMIYDISENALIDLCKNFPNLRILNLSGSNFSTIPDSLRVLKHLRYLDVSGSDIKIVPESIGYLRNLVFLDFTNCNELSHIPQSIMNLKQLMHLSLLNTKVEKIPEGLRNLENLIHLYGFNPDNDNTKGFSSLDELETMSQLIYMNLYSLERVSNINIAKRAKLGDKGKLQHLTLGYTLLSREDQVSQMNEEKVIVEGVLNELSPPHSLETLTIESYFGNCLPNWLNLGATHLPNLRYLYIRNCNGFKNLVLLGQLSNLDYLKIEDAYSIESVGEEFFGTNLKNKRDCIMAAFPKLNELIFEGLANWKEWEWNKGEESASMPKLQKLYIIKCPLLGSLPEGLSHHTATSLRYLEIQSAHSLVTIENFPSVQDIHVLRNLNLERISNVPSISHIEFLECPNLKSMENFLLNEEQESLLQSMELYDSRMEVLPEYLRTIMPRELRIDCSEELLRLITSQIRELGGGSKEWQKFQHIPKVKINSWDETLYTTYQKTPFSFTANFRV